MNRRIRHISPYTLLLLSACTAPIPTPVSTSPSNAPTLAAEPDTPIGPTPPATLQKGKQILSLVRVMDGGVCKNELQGAKGTFLLYADLQDIERLKHDQGTAVFNKFASKIEDLSSHALQAAIDETNLAEDPFSLGEDEAQEKLAHTLSQAFHAAATTALVQFQQETTLTIDITAYTPSLVFYQKGCSTELVEPETDLNS